MGDKREGDITMELISIEPYDLTFNEFHVPQYFSCYWHPSIPALWIVTRKGLEGVYTDYCCDECKHRWLQVQTLLDTATKEK